MSNLPGRFQKHETVEVDDGWGSLDQPLPVLRTTVTPDASRTILSHNESPDIPFDTSINPYKGCEHGCIYCFARPTHAFLDLSPGLDFETKLFSKPEAPTLLRKQLSKRGYRCSTLALGANTDPYQPVERRLEITRGVIRVLAEFRHPFCIVTKSNLVLRDVDLLAPLARDGLVRVYVSITTLSNELARTMEPRAPTPARRLEALRGLGEAGVPTGVMASPIIPGLNDTELESILAAAAEAGAGSASYILLRLPHEVRPLFEQWLRRHYPDRAAKVLNLLRDMRGGRVNDPRFGSRMRGGGPLGRLLHRRFELAATRLGLDRRRPSLDASQFRVPAGPGSQLPLF